MFLVQRINALAFLLTWCLGVLSAAQQGNEPDNKTGRHRPPPSSPFRVQRRTRTVQVTDAAGDILNVPIPDKVWNKSKNDEKALMEETFQYQFIDSQGTDDAPPPLNEDYLRVMRVKEIWTDTERRQVERMALTRLFEAVGAPQLADIRTAYCTWQGIHCQSEEDVEPQTYHTLAVDLSFQKLTGTLPTELLLMRDLQVFDVTGNRLRGSVPKEYWHLPHLREIQLSRNLFTSLPLELMSSSSSSDEKDVMNKQEKQSSVAPLQVLEVASNPLSAFTLPEEWHPALSNLRHLDLSNTYVTGTFHIHALPAKLQSLWLGHNILSGTLPSSFSKLPFLHTLDLGSNALTGTLPTKGLPPFETLMLAENDLEGPVDGFLRQLQKSSPNLWILQLHNNSFTGSLPKDGWSRLPQLGTLTLHHNHVEGPIPTDFYTRLHYNMQHLDLSHNQMNGTIATELGLLTNLQTIDVSCNQFQGTLPEEMLGMEPNLRLNFTGNLITGTVPSLFCGEGAANMLYREFGCDAVMCKAGTFSPYGHATLHSACRPCPDEDNDDDKIHKKVMGRTTCPGVDFIHGDLNGDGILSPREVLRMLYVDLMGRFWGAGYQSWADVSVNECDLAGITCNKDGTINKIDLSSANLCSDGDRRPGPIQYCKGLPSELGTLDSLEVLQTNSCQFLRGSIPSDFGNLRKLQILEMTGCNSLSGTLPTELGRLSNLRQLMLSHCRLQGSLPSEIFSIPSLVKLHISNNNLLTGTLPTAIGKLGELQELMISRNNLNGSIPTEIGGATMLENLEAYHNHLSSSIPSELAKCSNLKRVDIFSNELSGPIPDELAQVSLLQIVHLKNNKLEGTIPSGFGNMSFLSWLDLSDNKLHGTIPPSFTKSRAIKDIRVAGNRMYGSIPPELCHHHSLNSGATKEYGCDGVLCPLGTYSDSGHAIDGVGCAPCSEGETTLYLGSTKCEKLDETDILTILFHVMKGENWPDDIKKNWGDPSISPCQWGGIVCDEKGEIMSISFPLQAREELK